MKKILTSVLALVIALSSMAQANKIKDKKEFKGEFRKDGIEKLNLTDAQKTQLKSINEDFKQRMQDLKKSDNITVKEQHEKREALVAEHQQKVNAILTPDQQSKLAASKQDFKQKGGFHKGGAREGRFEQLSKDLNLTPEQTTKVQDLNQGLRTKMQDIRNNSSLTQEQKKEQVKDLMKKHREDIQSLLTQEQKQQLKSRLKNHQQPNGKTAVK